MKKVYNLGAWTNQRFHWAQIHFEGFVMKLFKLLGSNVTSIVRKGEIYDMNQCVITILPINLCAPAKTQPGK